MAVVVRRSDLIVIAEPKGRTETGSETADSYTIKEILLLHLAEKPGDVVTAHPANEEFFRAQAQHLKEHGFQGAPSPEFPLYRSSVTRDKNPLIVFLRAVKRPTSVARAAEKEAPAPVRYRYAVDGAYESVDKKQQVINELKKRPAH